MSPRPVSIIVWRDAKSDPPKPRMQVVDVLAVSADGSEVTVEDSWRVAQQPDLFSAWSPKPAVSGLTDEDVRSLVCDSDAIADLWERRGLPRAETRARNDRLRAALGGEKEEA